MAKHHFPANVVEVGTELELTYGCLRWNPRATCGKFVLRPLSDSGRSDISKRTLNEVVHFEDQVVMLQETITSLPHCGFRGNLLIFFPF